MQFDTPVKISSTTIVGGSKEAFDALSHVQGRVEKSISHAVNQFELVKYLETAASRGEEILSGLIKEAQTIGDSFSKAIRNPETLTAARAKAKESSKDLSV